jgi:hypothetical protein
MLLAFFSPSLKERPTIQLYEIVQFLSVFIASYRNFVGSARCLWLITKFVRKGRKKLITDFRLYVYRLVNQILVRIQSRKKRHGERRMKKMCIRDSRIGLKTCFDCRPHHWRNMANPPCDRMKQRMFTYSFGSNSYTSLRKSLNLFVRIAGIMMMMKNSCFCCCSFVISTVRNAIWLCHP